MNKYITIIVHWRSKVKIWWSTESNNWNGCNIILFFLYKQSISNTSVQWLSSLDDWYVLLQFAAVQVICVGENLSSWRVLQTSGSSNFLLKETCMRNYALSKSPTNPICRLAISWQPDNITTIVLLKQLNLDNSGFMRSSWKAPR